VGKRSSERSEVPSGDIVVSATWSGAVDLDVAVVDPSGRRAAAVSRLRGVRVEGATSRDHETVGFSATDAGTFVVEVTRADGSSAGAPPVSGTVTIKTLGQSRTIPFSLTGSRTQVGHVDVRWESEFVPVVGEEAAVGGFDGARAMRALGAVGVQQCAATGQVGAGHVTVTFAPTGRVSGVVIDDGTFSGTPAGRCVQAAFFSTPPVQPFSGPSVSVGRSFTLWQGKPWDN
jgi:hypothetical protein